jgi:GTP-binding protein
MRVLTRFMLSASDSSHFPPPQLPEVAFLGRSNVGKSSVINALLGQKIAKTSSTPGRTRSINFFEVRWPGKPAPELVFTDLPGYGYAKISKEISQEWPKFIEPYLRERPNLALCVALVDANVPTQESDRQMIAYLRETERNYVVVATKTDKLSGNQLQRAIQNLREEYAEARIVTFSAKSGKGREELWREIRASAEPSTEAGLID